MARALRPLACASSECWDERELADGPGAPRSLSRLIDAAAEQITRFTPHEACSACARGALIIDIRSQDSRERDGVVPGGLHIPRTVLEWRVALDSPWRNPHLAGPDQQLILICDHGYSSILAAATLVQLGVSRAGDIIGGLEAWRHAGLPVAPSRGRLSSGSLPGMGRPD